MRLKNALNVIINLAIAAYILSFLVHLMNWFEVGSLRSIISLVLAIVVIVGFFLNKQKSFLTYVSLIAAIIIVIVFLNSFFNIPILHYLDVLSGTSVLFIVITQGTKFNQIEYTETVSLDKYEFGKEEDLNDSYLSNEPTSNSSVNKFAKTAFATSVGLIILGMFFKFQHYPGSSILNILGFTGAVVCILYYTFNSSSK